MAVGPSITASAARSSTTQQQQQPSRSSSAATTRHLRTGPTGRLRGRLKEWRPKSDLVRAERGGSSSVLGNHADRNAAANSAGQRHDGPRIPPDVGASGVAQRLLNAPSDQSHRLVGISQAIGDSSVLERTHASDAATSSADWYHHQAFARPALTAVAQVQCSRDASTGASEGSRGSRSSLFGGD